MTEKEKCAKGELYEANSDQQLIKERHNTKKLLYKLNQLPPPKLAARNRIIKKILGHSGQNFEVIQPFYCDYGYNISIGDNFFSNHNLIILDAAQVTIGDNVLIGPNVGIYTAGHPLEPAPRNLGLEYAYPISIGNNVWIGASAIILPGISIGHNSVIGAGSVVTKDIPANVVAVGNPCKIIKKIKPKAHKKAAH